jgi:hypothetical protein
MTACNCGHEHGANDPHGACTSGKSCAASAKPARVDVAELRRLANGGTPGPWTSDTPEVALRALEEGK